MKTCPHCQSVSFDDQKTCYGCLGLFQVEPESRQLVVQAKSSYTKNQTTSVNVKQGLTQPEVVSATENMLGNTQPVGSGMARLHVKLPQGYHYDVYLEKPEGASIQIGWVPEAIPAPGALVIPARVVGD